MHREERRTAIGFLHAMAVALTIASAACSSSTRGPAEPRDRKREVTWATKGQQVVEVCPVRAERPV